MDVATHCIKLEEKKQKAIFMGMKTVLQIRNGNPFKQVKKVVEKLHRVAVEILSVEAISGFINQLMAENVTKKNASLLVTLK